MTLLDLLNAIAARVGRVRTGNGYSCNAGENVDVERPAFSPETDTLPRIAILNEGTAYEGEGARSAGFDSITEIAIAGLIAADFDARAVAPAQLENDLLRAAFEVPTGGDLLSQLGVILEPISCNPIRPEQGESVTEVLLSVRARWCDETLNTALEARP